MTLQKFEDNLSRDEAKRFHSTDSGEALPYSSNIQCIGPNCSKTERILAVHQAQFEQN